MEAINLIKLSGIVAKALEQKYTPAGVFSGSFWLMHNSAKEQEITRQKVTCSLRVIMLGKKMAQLAQQISPGQEVIVTGFLNERTIKNDSFLVLHAQDIELIDILNY